MKTSLVWRHAFCTRVPVMAARGFAFTALWAESGTTPPRPQTPIPVSSSLAQSIFLFLGFYQFTDVLGEMLRAG